MIGHLASAAEAVEKGFTVHGEALCDSIAHIATTFSYRQRASFSACGRMTSIALQLKALRSRTQPKLSSRAVADALGIPGSSYASYEDPKKFKKPILPLDLAKKLADLFEPRGVPKSETLALAGLTGELSTQREGVNNESEWVEVNGAVAAGRWLEQTDWPPSERYEVRFGASRHPGEKRFGVRMEGLSMNKTIQPNSDLECLWIKFSDVPPLPGDLVIVERKAHDLTEMTCKRLRRDGDGWYLAAESTEAEFDEAIRIGDPDRDSVTDDGIRVIGIVLSAKTDLARPGLSQRRYQHRE